jgi:hypothetical protein
MKHAIIFILITTAFIVVANLFFEYVINRDCPDTAVTLASVGMAILTLFYGWYVVNLLLKLLKLK